MKTLTINILFTLLFVLIISDFTLGITVAFKNKNLASRTCSDGLFRTMGECVLLFTLFLINEICPQLNIFHFFIWFLIIALIVKEAVSIGENLNSLNIWIPPIFKNSLKMCADKLESLDVNELKELIKDVKELKEKKEDNK